MAPIGNSRKSTSKEKRLSQPSTIARTPALEKPAVLRNNQNIQNTSQAQQKQKEISLSQIENITSSLETIETSIERIIDLQRDSRVQINTVLEDQRKSNETLDRLVQGIDNLTIRMEQLDHRAHNQQNQNFPEEMIIQAREELGLDLNIDLVHNGRNILNWVPFNRNNINLYGTKLLGRIFTKRELAEGTVEPMKSKAPPLDQSRIDKIKICYIRKLRTIENFVDHWPNVLKSLRQKCLDSKKYLKSHPEDADRLDGGHDDDDYDDDDGDDDDENNGTAPKNRSARKINAKRTDASKKSDEVGNEEESDDECDEDSEDESDDNSDDSNGDEEQSRRSGPQINKRLTRDVSMPLLD